MRFWFLAPLLFSLSFAAERATLTGQVTDDQGKPLAGATVIVYKALVKKGYSTFCPSCYADCGKRTLTDAAGAFTIKSLDPDLRFELLVVRNGYSPAKLDPLDPSAGPAGPVALKLRPPVADPKRVVHGRVVDAHGRPQRGAVVEPLAIEVIEQGHVSSIYGGAPGLEPIAVTGADGGFELAHSGPAARIMLMVEARGMAPKRVTLATGTEAATIEVSGGAFVRGRLVEKGKPVAGVQIGLIPKERMAGMDKLQTVGDPYDEARIATREDGIFLFPNVPVSVHWYLYGRMETIASRGATEPLECFTQKDDEPVDVGDLQLRPGHRLRGRVILSDRSPIAEGMRATMASARTGDAQTVMLPPDGRFEFTNLPSGKYSLFASVRGYDSQREVETTVDRDVEGIELKLEPVKR